MNVLKPQLRTTIQTLIERGATQREIERITGVDRKTIRSYARALANSPGVATGSERQAGQIPPPRPPSPSDAAITIPRPTEQRKPRRPASRTAPGSRRRSGWAATR